MLETTLCGLTLRNPTILASGIMGSTGASLKRMAEAGAGAVVTKSIGPAARQGHRNPSVIFHGGGVLNAVGLSNPGYRDFAQEMETAREGGVPVIASVFGSTPREYAEVAVGMEGMGAAALELNLSCPHAEGTGAFFGQDPDRAGEVVRAVKKEVDIPVIPKLTANVTDIVEIARACERAGADALTAINTLKAMAIDIQTRRPILANRTGGLSGVPIKAVGVRCVYEIAAEVDIPVIGCGGVATGEDALEYLMAGASAVEIGTAVATRGVDVFAKVAAEIEAYLRDHGISSVKEVIGAAH
ncbi:MAG: dihydroorotate dehydrogenase [Euryarchaeota archaeon]|nr:dihydroorotate dehydrogenase [Euryarchaeota archaeon]